MNIFRALFKRPLSAAEAARPFRLLAQGRARAAYIVVYPKVFEQMRGVWLPIN